MLTASAEELALLFGFPTVSSILRRYNIAPSQLAHVVFPDRLPGPPVLAEARWGHEGIRRPGRGPSLLINARAETAAAKPTFCDSLARRRCLVPASGYYEWSRPQGGPSPIPHLFRQVDGSPFAIAGLYEEPTILEANGSPVWMKPPGAHQLELFEESPTLLRPSTGATHRSFVLLTTAARGTARDIHHRMPLILDRAHFDAWLDPTTSAELILQSLREPSGVRLVPAVVSRRVNRVQNDDPDCARIEEPGSATTTSEPTASGGNRVG